MPVTMLSGLTMIRSASIRRRTAAGGNVHRSSVDHCIGPALHRAGSPRFVVRAVQFGLDKAEIRTVDVE